MRIGAEEEEHVDAEGLPTVLRQNALKGEAQQRSLDCGGSLLLSGGEAAGRSRRLCQPPCRRSVTAEDVAGTPDSNPREHPSQREGCSYH